MSLLQLASLLIVLAGAFDAVNYFFLRLPAPIGILVVALLTSLVMMAGDAFLGLHIGDMVEAAVEDIDFSDALMEGALGLVLFAGALVWFLYRTRAGLVLRSVGESPQSAHALGYPVRRIRLAAVMFGGAMCGLAGAYLSVIYTPLWVEGMVAGKGWIALALTTFATWRPARVLLGAYLFGGVTMLQFHLQGQGVQVPSQFLTMLPYLATIVVLALISRNPTWIRVNMPASLGKPFHPGA